jgi:hypothetical protein
MTLVWYLSFRKRSMSFREDPILAFFVEEDFSCFLCTSSIVFTPLLSCPSPFAISTHRQPLRASQSIRMSPRRRLAKGELCSERIGSYYCTNSRFPFAFFQLHSRCYFPWHSTRIHNHYGDLRLLESLHGSVRQNLRAAVHHPDVPS